MTIRQPPDAGRHIRTGRGFRQWRSVAGFVGISTMCCLAASDPLFQLERVAEGVYAAIARSPLDSNAAIVLLDDSVLVVDTHARPSTARALIGQIRDLTSKPVRFVVDTHFHWDHYQGNSAYPAAWPEGVEIIASSPTFAAIRSRGIPRAQHERTIIPRRLDEIRKELGRTADPNRKAELQDRYRMWEDYAKELHSMSLALPTMTFQRSLVLHRASRTVQILWLGRGHTDGDVVVHLPREKVLVSGDLLHAYMPYMADSSPYDWIETLEKLRRLDFEFVIPGHGSVLKGKTQLDLWKSYLTDLMQETARIYAEGASLEQAVGGVTAALSPRYADRFPAGMYSFSNFIRGNVEKAYRVVSGNQE
ncbi:MAG: MBL fold metallo-hydrolase [Acidobacteriota bacterium]